MGSNFQLRNLYFGDKIPAMREQTLIFNVNHYCREDSMANIEVHKKSFEPKEVISEANKACGWFAAIAIFSLINSLLIFFKSSVSFVIGLGITMIVDAP